MAARRPIDHKGNNNFSFVSGLKQRAAEVLGGGGGGRSRSMEINIIREDEGGLPSGVTMNLVPLGSVQPPAKKISRVWNSFSCDIHASTTEDYKRTMEECKEMVLEVGGTILEQTYPGGFLYDLSFATAPNPLDSLDETIGGGHIDIQSYDASITEHPHPLRSNPVGIGAGAREGVAKHMERFGLTPESHRCNGRNKPCTLTCEFRPCGRKRPLLTANNETWENAITSGRDSQDTLMTMQEFVAGYVAPSPSQSIFLASPPSQSTEHIASSPSQSTEHIASTPPQLKAHRPVSSFRVEDMIAHGKSTSELPNPVTPRTMKRSSNSLTHLIAPNESTLEWLQEQQAIKKAFYEGQRFPEGERFDGLESIDLPLHQRKKRPRPTAIYGTKEPELFPATRQPTPCRTSPLERGPKPTGEAKSSRSRADSGCSVVTILTVAPPSPVPTLRPRSSQESFRSYTSTLPGDSFQSTSSFQKADRSSSMYSATSTQKLQKKLGGGIRKILGGF